MLLLSAGLKCEHFWPKFELNTAIMSLLMKEALNDMYLKMRTFRGIHGKRTDLKGCFKVKVQ